MGVPDLILSLGVLYGIFNPKSIAIRIGISNDDFGIITFIEVIP